LLSVAVALIVRNTAAALTAVLALLFVFPIRGALVTEPHWREWLTEWSPMSAGRAIQTTLGVDALPVGPWQGLSILAAYAGGALLLGGILFQVRDA
jgi:ABC-2 type transport system permease protein